MALAGHHQGSRETIAPGRAEACGVVVAVDVVLSVGLLGGQVDGWHDGGPCVLVGEDDGGADVVGSLVVALVVGADDVGVCRVVGGAGGGAGEWPASGGSPVT
jgi:hypothetical protein